MPDDTTFAMDFDDYNPCPVSVMFAKGKEQVQREGGKQCLYPAFPDSRRIYFAMEALDDSMCVHREIGWEREICVRKADLPHIMELWYPDGTASWDYMALINQIEGDVVWIIGFGD